MQCQMHNRKLDRITLKPCTLTGIVLVSHQKFLAVELAVLKHMSLHALALVDFLGKHLQGPIGMTDGGQLGLALSRGGLDGVEVRVAID